MRADWRLPDRPEFPNEFDQGIPTLRATLGGVETVLRIDTGASLFESRDVYVNVPPALWAALTEESPELAPESRLTGSGASGETVELKEEPRPRASWPELRCSSARRAPSSGPTAS